MFYRICFRVVTARTLLFTLGPASRLDFPERRAWKHDLVMIDDTRFRWSVYHTRADRHPPLQFMALASAHWVQRSRCPRIQFIRLHIKLFHVRGKDFGFNLALRCEFGERGLYDVGSADFKEVSERVAAFASAETVGA